MFCLSSLALSCHNGRFFSFLSFLSFPFLLFFYSFFFFFFSLFLTLPNIGHLYPHTILRITKKNLEEDVGEGKGEGNGEGNGEDVTLPAPLLVKEGGGGGKGERGGGERMFGAADWENLGELFPQSFSYYEKYYKNHPFLLGGRGENCLPPILDAPSVIVWSLYGVNLSTEVSYLMRNGR